MGQLPICCCSKAKKFNDFSRAGVGVRVSGRGGILSGNQALVANDPNARQPPLELAELTGDEDAKQKLPAMVEAMKMSAAEHPVSPRADPAN
jgi:hypothetical protein